jgi:hypothetical protein
MVRLITAVLVLALAGLLTLAASRGQLGCSRLSAPRIGDLCPSGF